MRGVNFLSRSFTPSPEDQERLRELEKFVGRQSKEAYIKLLSMERRLTSLEERIKRLEKEKAEGT